MIVVDKPSGMTSHDVVDEVRRRLGTRKVGHAGTLDPDATGVLLIGVGRATRFLAYAQRAPKRYRAIAVFGVTTTTQDATGDIVMTTPALVREEDVRGAFADFVGEIEQVPPMVSAVKVQGERLYRKARRGEEVARGPRRVSVYSLEVVRFEGGDHPEATLDVHCSGGTFVRTLVHDVGGRLGCGAHLKSLRRIEAGGFTDDEAVALELVDAEAVRPLADAVRVLPSLDAKHAAEDVGHGRALPAPSDELEEGAPVALVADGELLGVYRRAGDRLVPDRVVGR
ncbi:MAG: tRNA pseudouridine(55) synthase TruB [Actinomycetota bacterium]